MDQALTFYIASGGQQIPAVQVLANLLVAKGYRWHEQWDWTVGYGGSESVAVALMDKIGARDCDLFIYLASDPTSIGANREYGVRWGTNKEIHVIGGKMHLFDMSPGIHFHESITKFLGAL